MQIVMSCIEVVFDVTGIDYQGSGKTGLDFLAAVSLYFTKVGQGLFLTDELFQLTLDIINCARDVSIEVSAGVRLQLETILISLRQYQMSCVSEFIIIQQKLIQIISVSISSLDITGVEFDAVGEIVEYAPAVFVPSER